MDSVLRANGECIQTAKAKLVQWLNGTHIVHSPFQNPVDGDSPSRPIRIRRDIDVTFYNIIRKVA